MLLDLQPDPPCKSDSLYMGASKNRGVYPPKWMVYFMENPIKIDDLGGFYHPYFWKHPYGGSAYYLVLMAMVKTISANLWW